MADSDAAQRHWQEKFKARLRKAVGDAKNGKRGSGQQLKDLEHDLSLRQLKHPWIGPRPERIGSWLERLQSR